MLSGPRHEASEASHAIPRGAESGVRAPRLELIYSALPIVPGRRVRGEGAAPTVRWCCPRTRSMARLQRLSPFSAFSRVKDGAAIARQTGLFRTADRERLDAVARDTGRHADDASRQEFSRERATHEA